MNALVTPTVRWRAVWHVVLCALVLACAGCKGCDSADVLARLEAGPERVDRDFARELERWQPAKVGDEFRLGDGVRTGRAATALLGLSDASKLRLNPETTIRFLDRDPGANQHAFEVRAGAALLEVGPNDLRLKTSIGMATLAPGTRVRLSRSGDGVRYGVEVGLARFETAGGRTLEVGPGKTVLIGIGEATLEPLPDGATDAGSAQPSPTADAAAAPGAQPSGEVNAVVTGKGAQLRQPGAEAWLPLPPGPAALQAGTALRLERGTRVSLERRGQRATLQGRGQFSVGGAGAALVQTERGRLSLESGAQVELSVPGGSITFTPAARADVEVSERATSLQVHAGQARVTSAAGSETVRAGERAELDKSGKTNVQGRGPGYADFYVGAGASFAIHDPAPPTAVGFRFGSHCAAGGLLELLRANGEVLTFSRGDRVASVLLPAGGHRYRLRCLDENGAAAAAATTGTVTVLRDSGVAQLPRTAPATRIDTDGRRYTVLYQNRLPKLSVRWPKAPEAKSYTLAVATSGGATRRLSANAAAYAFAEGALGEGSHELTFEGGGVRSPTTTVAVRFDNAAPTASLRSPPNRGFGPGAAVTVAGVTLEGWSASVDGKPLALDDQHRFSAEVTAPGDQRGIAVQLTHPRRGVHYYVRHAATGK